MRLTARGLKGYATDPLALSWKQGVPEALVAAEGREVRLRAVALASAIYVQKGRAQYKILDAPVLTKDAPPDVTLLSRSATDPLAI